MIALLLALAAASEVQLRERGSGEPLTGATVAVWEGEQVVANGVTDARGVLVLGEALDGERALRLYAEGHRPVDLVGTLPLAERLVLFVDPATELVVVVEAFQDSPHVSRHRVDAEQALETPGVAEDSFRLIQSLPGVSVQRELSPTAGELSIRGSAPGDNRVYLDGVEIPYLYHYNQYASVLPTSLVGEMELFSSTFGAQYGDAVGAVVEASARDDAPEALHGHANFNFWMVGASLSGPLGKPGEAGQGWHFRAAGRRSYQDLAGEQSAQYTLWPTFHDYHARIERVGERSRSAIFAYGAGDRYDRAAGELDLLDPVEASESPSFKYRRAFEVVGGMHRWESDARSEGRFVAAIVADRNTGTLAELGRQRLRTTYLSSRLDTSRRLAEKLYLDAGWELRGERTGLVVDSAGEVGILVAEEAPALARAAAVDAVAWRLRAGLYGQLAWSPGAWSINPGVRLATDTGTATVLPEPRLAVRWRVDDALELKLAAGRYHQAPETEHLMPGTGDPDLPNTGAWQLALGFDKTFSGRLELSVEGYGKWLEDPLVYPVGQAAQVRDRGAAFGVEAVTRYRLLETVFLWGWVSVSRSLVETAEGWRPGDGDQPVIGGFVFSWDLAEGWNVGLRWRYGSGQPFTTVSGVVYDGSRDRWLPVAGPLNDARLPAYMKLDVRGARTWTFDRWSLQLAAELWWVPARYAQIYPTWSYDYGEQGWVTGPSFVPLLSVRATF